MKKFLLVIMSFWIAASTLSSAVLPEAPGPDCRTALRQESVAPEGSDHGADLLQYLPMVFPEIMKISGAPTRSGWGRLAVSQGFSVIMMAGSVYTLKHLVNSRRPDRSDYDSFPSGHCAWAFAGATVVAKEFGWRSPWYAVGAYAFATGIAIERVVDRHHSAVDAACGAVLGVAMTELGYWITDRIYGDRGFCERYNLSVRPTVFVTSTDALAGRSIGSSMAPGLIVSCGF